MFRHTYITDQLKYYIYFPIQILFLNSWPLTSNLEPDIWFVYNEALGKSCVSQLNACQSYTLYSCFTIKLGL